MQLELITRTPTGPSYPTPLLFVPGAWQGAWCWDEHFLPYFAAQGFTAHALSFRNHGQSASVGSLRWKRIRDYVADVAQVVEQIGQPPVLIGHSMGGHVVQKYLERASVPAAVLMAAVPPHGAVPVTLRVARRHPLAFLKTNLQLRLWPIIGSPQLARDTLFSRTMPATQLMTYFSKLHDESYLAYLDIMLLDLPRPQRMARVPTLVLGGTADALFTPGEFRKTARTYHAPVHLFPDMAHEMMLEAGWQAVADTIIAWLKTVPGVC